LGGPMGVKFDYLVTRGAREKELVEVGCCDLGREVVVLVVAMLEVVGSDLEEEDL
ncbi:hypothetical protein PanWU01x14_258950, partial [Parasponia andersonii]